MKKFISFIAVAAATSLLCACGAERVQSGEPVTGTGAAAAEEQKQESGSVGGTTAAPAGTEAETETTTEAKTAKETTTTAETTATTEPLVYGSGDYTRINPAMDEHGEINILLFNGLTAHNGDNEVVPGLARSWEFDEETCTYTFYLEENVQWHDGEAFTADDVKFTIEAIMDPENGSENAPNYEDVEEIRVLDQHTISFQLAAPNVAFLDYMTMAVLPEHLLAGEDPVRADRDI